jgi:ABC-type uncharacterized transport system substrate-binding protein
MRRRELIAGIVGCLVWSFAARGQQAGKMFRVGWATGTDPETLRPFEQALVSALQALGYVAGRNIVYDIRYGENDPSRVPVLVDELILLKPDVLVGIEPIARVMLSKTSTIPIVMLNSADPIAAGLVKSLAHPGGNVTGVSMQWAELGPKEIELLREALPRLTHIAHLLDANVPASRLAEQITSGAAHNLGIAYTPYKVGNRSDLDRALAEMEGQRPDALIVTYGSSLITGFMPAIADKMMRLRIPIAGTSPVRRQKLGILIGYGPVMLASFSLAATYVDRILKGANPRDLPVEQPRKFELSINLKSAKALGLTIPQSLLARADEVIE